MYSSVAGVQFSDYKAGKFVNGLPVTLQGDPTNPVDPLAVKVIIYGVRIGWLPAKSLQQYAFHKGAITYPTLRLYTSDRKPWDTFLLEIPIINQTKVTKDWLSWVDGGCKPF